MAAINQISRITHPQLCISYMCDTEDVILPWPRSHRFTPANAESWWAVPLIIMAMKNWIGKKPYKKSTLRPKLCEWHRRPLLESVLTLHMEDGQVASSAFLLLICFFLLVSTRYWVIICIRIKEIFKRLMSGHSRMICSRIELANLVISIMCLSNPTHKE